MAVNLCNFCGTFKELRDHRICQECLNEYLAVKAYIETRPKTPIMTISSDLNITVKKLMIFVEQGRFIVVEQDKTDRS